MIYMIRGSKLPNTVFKSLERNSRKTLALGLALVELTDGSNLAADEATNLQDSRDAGGGDLCGEGDGAAHGDLAHGGGDGAGLALGASRAAAGARQPAAAAAARLDRLHGGGPGVAEDRGDPFRGGLPGSEVLGGGHGEAGDGDKGEDDVAELHFERVWSWVEGGLRCWFFEEVESGDLKIDYGS